LYSRGFLISEITGRNADVPADEMKMVLEAVMPRAKVVWPMAK
jgi:hypothetical protein